MDACSRIYFLLLSSHDISINLNKVYGDDARSEEHVVSKYEIQSRFIVRKFLRRVGK